MPDSTGIRAVYKGGDRQLIQQMPFLRFNRSCQVISNETFRIAGQIALATTLGGTIYGMAMDGRIQAAARSDGQRAEAKTAQQVRLAAGNVPYSFDIGGGNRVSV